HSFQVSFSYLQAPNRFVPFVSSNMEVVVLQIFPLISLFDFLFVHWHGSSQPALGHTSLEHATLGGGSLGLGSLHIELKHGVFTSHDLPGLPPTLLSGSLNPQ